ncbi:MAG: hypothetical protein ACI97B_004222, partial [Verrucomicrobiales bacterium]
KLNGYLKSAAKVLLCSEIPTIYSQTPSYAWGAHAPLLQGHAAA